VTRLTLASRECKENQHVYHAMRLRMPGTSLGLCADGIQLPSSLCPSSAYAWTILNPEYSLVLSTAKIILLTQYANCLLTPSSIGMVLALRGRPDRKFSSRKCILHHDQLFYRRSEFPCRVFSCRDFWAVIPASNGRY
jgi:hypothetical protein